MRDIRLLTDEDVASFQQLRLKALKELPKAFAANYQEESMKTVDYFTKLLKENIGYLGAFSEDKQLIGVIGILTSNLEKMKHKGSLSSFYVTPEYRRKGVGDALLKEAIEYAKREGLEQIQLVVAHDNIKAKKKYESLGFESFAYEKQALKVNGTYIDEEHFVLFL